MLLERGTALELLSRHRSEAYAGPGRMVLVGGEAGIGKTSLLRAFAPDALWGACDPLFTPRPLGPLHDMAAELGAEVAAALARDAGRIGIFGAVFGSLARQPRTVVFEDVHWADEATLDLLAWLGRRIEGTCTLLVASWRDDEVGRSHPLRRVLGALPAATRLTLSPLSAAAVRELAAGRTRDAAVLHRASGGNPFFVTELLAVGEAGGVPPTVRDAVLARAARLTSPAREALDAAAIVGPRVEPALVGGVMGSDASALEECLAAGVLREAGAELLEFRHELARQAVLGAISAPRRLLLHRRALAELRGRPATDLARLAHHAEAAQDRQAVLAFAPAAARQAAAIGARRQAHDQYARALRFADEIPAAEHAELLEAYALECLAIGTAGAGIAARQRAIAMRAELGQIARQAEGLCRLSNLFVDVAHMEEANEALRQAFALVSALAPCRETAYAWRTQAHLCMLRGDDEQAIAAARQAIEQAERFGDVEAVISALNSQGTALSRRDMAAGCALLERSAEMARAAGRWAQVFNAELNLAETAVEFHDFVRGERHALAGIAVANDLQMDRTIPEGSLALCRLGQGRWGDAGELALRVLTDCPERRASRIVAQTVLGRLRARRGDAGAWEALDEAISIAETSTQLIYIAGARAARAEAAWLEGDAPRCAREALAAYGLAQRHRHPWFVGELSYWLALSGQPADSAEFAAAPYAHQAQGRWREAVAAWRHLGCPYEAARAQAEGDLDAQRAALAEFEQLGARPAAETLRARLHDAGVRGLARGPRASTRERLFGLTTRELETLQLLCAGLRNAEIAQRLHRSVRTVDHHLAAVFAKLGVESRVAAIQAAQRAGLHLPAAQSGQTPPAK